MCKQLFVILTGFSCLAAGAAGNGALGSASTPDVRNLFTPTAAPGRDAVVVVSGYLDGVCYRLQEPTVERDMANGRVTIEIRSVRVQKFCHPIAIRFDRVIHLGALPEGRYQVTVSGDASPQTLFVSTARENESYAPVQSVKLIDNQLVLQGQFINTCQRISEVRWTQNGDTLELEPLLAVDEADGEGQACRVETRAFEQKVALPELKTGRYLLHVHSAEGRAVDRVFDFPMLIDDRDLLP